MSLLSGQNAYVHVRMRLPGKNVSGVSVQARVIHQNSVMKRIFAALKSKSPSSIDVAEDVPPTTTLSAEDVVMPDIYADEHVATVSDLKIISPASPDADDEAGFNPYDTAVLQNK